MKVQHEFQLARTALGMWTLRKSIIAAISAILVGLLIGYATVLIPNSVFSRDVPPETWNYPVWIISSILLGMLIATYFRDGDAPAAQPVTVEREEKRTTRLGAVGGAMAWFAVGCPVCNKIALLVLGYSGALTWFAPAQPFLAAFSLIAVAFALAVRLRGEVACPVPTARRN